MNIFVLDINPRLAALYHNDRHCVKMILETAQLLCTAHLIIDGDQIAKKQIGELILRPTHMHHPCAVWVREASLNYEWAHELGVGLLDQYTQRYGKVHAFDQLFVKLGRLPLNLQHLSMRTPFRQCMPDAYKQEDAVEAYRDYYFYEKQHLAMWKAPADVPHWWIERKRHAASKTRRAV